MSGLRKDRLTAEGILCEYLYGKDVGADIFITKPFDPDELIKKVSKVLDLEK